jgi:CDP-diacylglycerol--glycerol-3-phosphate 3-phosphatidyltransferase
MSRIIYKNTANLIVLIRIGCVFIAIYCLSHAYVVVRVYGIGFFCISVILDGVDGYLARKFRIVSAVGGLVDTLGDRLTENLMVIFLSYKHIFPLVVAIIFITRSFLADFIRTLNLQKGINTFKVNTSKLGKFFVASVVSRCIYLLLKTIWIFGGGIILIWQGMSSRANTYTYEYMRHIVNYGSYVVITISVIRFAVLCYDSRYILRKYFGYLHEANR